MKLVFLALCLTMAASALAAPKRVLRCDPESREFLQGWGQLEAVLLVLPAGFQGRILSSTVKQKEVLADVTIFVETGSRRIETKSYQQGTFSVNGSIAAVTFNPRTIPVRLFVNRDTGIGVFTIGSTVWKLRGCQEGTIH